VSRRLKPFLDHVLARYNRREYLATDPLSAVYRYPDPRDQEVVAFVAAGLAFGNVKAVLAGIAAALAPLGPHPARTLTDLGPAAALRKAQGFNYRWVRDRDMANLWLMLGSALRAAGGLEPLFAASHSGAAPDTLVGADGLVVALTDLAPSAVDVTRRGTRSFLPRVSGPGASKRLHMFLRWMVRKDELDLGLWTAARPAQLLVPLDTHVARLSRRLGLTARRTAGKAMAQEITAGLRVLDPADPIKYDFALAHLGILGVCPSRRDPHHCSACPLSPVCQME
jgi:uncharacterized protein (TIGR02757 family)